MKMQTKKLTMTLSLLALVACSKSFETNEVDTQIDKTAAANAEAKNYAAWESSASNPEKVIAEISRKILAKELTSEQVCASFEKRSVIDLTMYENQIRQKETEFIFAPCKSSLIKKLDEHWREEQKKLGIPSTKSAANLDALSKGISDENGITTDTQVTQTNQPQVRRFDKVVYVERDVSQGYFAVTGDLPAGQVALTFDDGPSGLYTKDVLQALENANVKATWFAMGKSVRQYPDALKAVARAGHSIGSHTDDHLCQSDTNLCQANNGGKRNKVTKVVTGGIRLSVAQAIKDIASGHQAIKNVLGWVYPFFRFPYGESSPALKEFLQKSGTGEFYWSIDSNDWRAWEDTKKTNPWTTEEMVNSVIAQAKAKKRGIVLNHDIQKKTAIGLPAILNRLYDEGFQPVVFIPKDKNSIKESGLLRDAAAILQQ
jgi:peptidoglycan/xylan/chitin deacetylase (PgdA/CDA1 family)